MNHGVNSCNLTKDQFAAMIDHTNLKPVATRRDIEQLCREAVESGFASVCVNPVYVPFAAGLLKNTKVKVCTVVGFPLGASAHDAKAAEAAFAVKQGAQEIDMVIDIGAVKEGRFADVEQDIAGVVTASAPAAVKVILETCYLTENEIIQACTAAVNAGAAFVKTSTGFGSGGATVDAVVLMRRTVGSSVGVKAAGGIKTLETAIALIDAGANRLGCSAGMELLQAFPGR